MDCDFQQINSKLLFKGVLCDRGGSLSRLSGRLADHCVIRRETGRRR